MSRTRDGGVILINVLVVLGLGATIVYMMLTLADISIARSQRFGEAGAALALIRGAEQSAIAALRRDMIEAPDTDNAAEPWAQVAQEKIEIEGGTLETRISDAQALFNVNTLATGGLRAVQTLQTILTALEIAPEMGLRIAASIVLEGPVQRLGDLTARAGVRPEDVEKMRGLMTALPGRGEVNVNAAPSELMAILFNNPVQARLLAAKRTKAGLLTPEDLAASGVILPPGMGFTSDLFRTNVTVRIGRTEQSMESLLQRRRDPEDQEEVVVIQRGKEMAAVSPPPPQS